MNQLLTKARRHLRVFSSIDPERDWIVVSSLSTIVLVSIIVWNAFAFDTVANGGVIGSPVNTAAPVFSQSSLDAIHSVFDNRAVEQDKYTSGVYQYIDPSR